MSYFEDCYDKAITGDTTGLKALKVGADVGNEEARHLLSCVYGNPSSPFYDDKLYKFWEEQKFKPIRPLEEDIDEPINNGQDELVEKDYVPNHDFGTKNYHPNWTRVEPNRDKKSKEESSVKAESKAEKPSFGNFLFSDDGRISQSDYVIFFCIWGVIFLFIVISASGSAYNAPSKTLQWLGFLLFYPFMQVATKRCHDIGKWGMYLFIPFYFIYLLFVSGDKYKNEYGYPPTDYFNIKS